MLHTIQPSARVASDSGKSDVQPLPPLTDASPPEPAQLERRRLAMVGSLTAGLAHTLTNAIMPALLRLDTLALSPEHTANTQAELRGVRDSLTSLQSLANGLRLISGDPLALGERDTTQLDALWHHIEPLVCAATTAETRLDAKIPVGLPVVSVPPSLIAQVLMALVLNARQSLRGSHDAMLRIRASQQEDAVVLSVWHSEAMPVGEPAAPDPLCFETHLESPLESQVGSASATRLSQLRALLQQYDSDLTTDESTPTGCGYTMRLRVLTQAVRQERVANTCVWVWLSDPRRAVVVRLVLAQHRCVEWIPPRIIGEGPGGPDVIICDLTTLPAVDAAAVWSTSQHRPARFIVIGAPPANWVPRDVTWIDPMQLGSLSYALQDGTGDPDASSRVD